MPLAKPAYSEDMIDEASWNLYRLTGLRSSWVLCSVADLQKELRHLLKSSKRMRCLYFIAAKAYLLSQRTWIFCGVEVRDHSGHGADASLYFASGRMEVLSH